MDFSSEIIEKIALLIKDDIRGYIDTHATEYEAFLETRKEEKECVDMNYSVLLTSKSKKWNG